MFSSCYLSLFQIEGLLDDEDFKTRVTREEYEGLCEDLFSRIKPVIDEAMKMSEITWVRYYT